MVVGFLVTVNQGDEQKQRTQRDGPGHYCFHQEDCPAAKQEHVNEQPRNTHEQLIRHCRKLTVPSIRSVIIWIAK